MMRWRNLHRQPVNPGTPKGVPPPGFGDTQALYEEAKQKSWTVISMKDDWKRIFAFES